ncbi:MAG: hypothetical protein R2847_12675 [Bacteroidia bacterium]
MDCTPHVFVGSFVNDEVGNLTDIQAGEHFDTPMQPHGGSEQIAWSADGKKLAYTCKNFQGKGICGKYQFGHLPV